MRHTIAYIAAMTLAVSVALAQGSATKGSESKGVHAGAIDEPPAIVGGASVLAKSLVYPAAARKDSIQGTVYVEATVSKEGDVIKAVVVKGVREDLDKASLEAVRNVKFFPGKHKGSPVEAIVTIPISFKLKNKDT